MYIALSFLLYVMFGRNAVTITLDDPKRPLMGRLKITGPKDEVAKITAWLTSLDHADS